MHAAHRFISAVALIVLSASSFATTTVYTSAASFLPRVATGSYTENFDTLSSDPSGLFGQGAFSYTISAPGLLYGSGEYIGTSLPNEALTLNFTSGNVTALGANFYVTNLSDAFQAVSMTLTLSDSTVVAFRPATVAASYRGFTSDLAITSLVINAPGESLYVGLDNLTVGTATPAVPEPTTWALMGLGLAGIAAAARRKA